ncbi:MAG: DUF5011 domain-containing protein [Gammaproteobacteria bacterium]|nr:DUF5011 domain-containing protein [Gammaproteobacteria bacterium]
MHYIEQQKQKIGILLLCCLTLFISGCKLPWEDNKERDVVDPVDSTVPVITLTGANPQTIETGSDYTELGATATDNVDGNITANITIDSSAVDTATIGSYSVTYNVSDAAGNAAVTQTRTVDVVADATPPVITLTGDNPQTIEVGAAYTELNATAADNIDGDISGSIVIDASTVDTNTVANYSVTYDVSDTAGNAATTETRTVNVVDTTVPVITLTGDNPQNIDIDSVYTELGATASDNYDGNISANIVIDETAVDTSTEGSYNVTYNVADAAGNNAVQVTRTVNVGAQATTFFTGQNATSGWELFVTDGTPDGTLLLKDINPAGDSRPDNYIMINDVLYFRANDGTNSYELWKSNGTAEGTVMVKDINLTDRSNPRNLTNVDDTLYFTADDGVNGTELWKSNGTEGGTVMVKDIVSGPGSSGLRELINFNGVLYFIANDGITPNNQLWKSDGTPEGTIAVTTTLTTLYYLTNVNGTLLFRASDGAIDEELWKSDGTPEGTEMLKDINPTNDSSPMNFVNVDDTLFFVADDGIHDRELWKSNGTAEGTVMVKDINTSGNSRVGEGAELNGSYFFQATDGVDSELWKSDGTAAGTMIVKDINPAGSGGASYMVNANGKLFYAADDGTNGRELWTSDGTTDGTFMLKDIKEGGSSWANPEALFNQDRPIILPDGRLIFSAEDVINGNEPWVTDGTIEGTILLKDVNPGTGDGFYYDS